MKSIQPVSSVLCDGLHRSPSNHTELENAAQKKPKTQSDSNVLTQGSTQDKLFRNTWPPSLLKSPDPVTNMPQILTPGNSTAVTADL